MQKYLLGIDIGTTNVKATLYNTEFERKLEGSSEYQTYFPNSGWAEQNAEHWWKAVVESLKKITSSSNINSSDIQGICVSSQAPAVVPLDCDGRPLRNALIWMDRRSEKQCDYLKKHITQEKVLSITGNRIDPYFALAKLLWYKENESELYNRTYKILQVNGYVNYRFTGSFSCDKVHASLTGLYDIKALAWSAELCEKLGLRQDMLPRVFESTDIIGYVNKAAAIETGLCEGIPVMAGTVDASSSAIEAGVIGKGEAVEMTGTSTVFIIGCDEWHYNANLVSMLHSVKGHSLFMGPISSTGASLKWYRDQIGFAAEEKDAKTDPYKYMDLLAAKASPGANNLLFLPYMAGERAPIWDTYARGVFFGLTHSTTRSQMIRAILEGSAFALYHNIREAENAGMEITTLRAMGGGSRSPIWLQIKASIINKPIVTLKNSSDGTFGNALLAGYGVSIYSDIREVLDRKLVLKDTYLPRPDEHRHYEKLYKVYRNIYEHTKLDFEQLSKIKP